MTAKEIIEALEFTKFTVYAEPKENLQPDCDPDTDEVVITYNCITWYVWLAPNYTELQCYDLPDGGYDGMYIDSIADLLDHVMEDYIIIWSARNGK